MWYFHCFVFAGICASIELTLVTSLCDQTLYIYMLCPRTEQFLPLQARLCRCRSIIFYISPFALFTLSLVFFLLCLFICYYSLALAISPIVQLIHIYIYIHTTHNIHIYLESRVMLSLNSNARVMVSYMREYIDVHAILSRRPWHCLSLIQCSNVRLLFMVCSARRSIVTYIYIYSTWYRRCVTAALTQTENEKKNKCKKHANTNVSFNLCFVLHVFCIFLSISPHSFIHSLFESIYRVVLIAFAHWRFIVNCIEGFMFLFHPFQPLVIQ